MQLLTLWKTITSCEGGLQSSFLISHFKKLHLLKAAFICSDNKHNYWHQEEKRQEVFKKKIGLEITFLIYCSFKLYTPLVIFTVSAGISLIFPVVLHKFCIPRTSKHQSKENFLIQWTPHCTDNWRFIVTYSGDEICVFWTITIFL